MKRTTIVVVVLALSVLVAGCGGPGDAPNDTNGDGAGDGVGDGAGDGGAGDGAGDGGAGDGAAALDEVTAGAVHATTIG